MLKMQNCSKFLKLSLNKLSLALNPVTTISRQYKRENFFYRASTAKLNKKMLN